MPPVTFRGSAVDVLRSACVVADLTGRGELAVAGPDAVDLLQGLLTNDVRALRPGAGCHAALLTPKGRMRAELAVLRTEGELLLDCDAALARPLAEALSGYVPFSRSTLVDRTGETGVVHLEGPEAPDALAAAGFPEPAVEPFAHVAAQAEGRPLRVVRVSRAGETGFDLRCARESVQGLVALLASHGAAGADAAILEAGRIEAGIPRWGAELDESVLPNEAWLERTAISYTKGCYLGQETVARIRTYGHVSRRLVALLLPLGSGAEAGSTVRAGGEAVGAVTSAVDSERRGRRIALAFVRRGHEEPGTVLAVESPSGAIPATVVAVPLGALGD